MSPIIDNKILLNLFLMRLPLSLYVFFLLLSLEMRELLSIYLHRKDLRLVCSESDCESPRKYLFKDLDGRALGLPPPVSVFLKTEGEWTGSFFNTGQLYLNSTPPGEGAVMWWRWFGHVF